VARKKVLALKQIYINAYNQIVRPDDGFWASNYFRTKWVPLLGHRLAWLIIALRRRCHYSGREWCEVSYQELAAEIGVSRRTVIRLLQSEYARFFIQEVKQAHCYNPAKGKPMQKPNRYRVQMDDPLTPEDQKRLKTMLADEAIRLGIQSSQVVQADLFGLLHRDRERQNHKGDILSPLSPDQGDKMSPILYGCQNVTLNNRANISIKDKPNAIIFSTLATTTTRGEDGEKIAAEIWQRFQELSGAEREPSPKEQELLRELLAEGYTADQICVAMEEVFASFRPKFRGDRIQSFAYCVPRIRELEPGGREGLPRGIGPIPQGKGEFGRGLEEAEKLWAQINGAPPNAFEREELAKLAHRCDTVACQAPYPELAACGGAGWVAAAIADAARAGSQFIAVRRVEVIIDRWMVEGPPWEPAFTPEPTQANQENASPVRPPTQDEDVGEVETAEGKVGACELWQRCLSELALQMTRATFDTWLRNTRPVACEDNTLVIGVRSEYARDWLENRLLPVIQRNLKAIAGQDIGVRFVAR